MMLIAFRLITVIALIAASFQSLRADCTVTCTATVPANATAGVSVSFESNASPCACSGAASYSWTFGDGADSSSQNPSHVYSSSGTYNWQLTVTADSTTCTKSGAIVVGSGAPAAGTYTGTTSAGLAFSLTVNGASQVTGWNVSYANLCSGSGSTGTSGTNCSIVAGAFSCGNAVCSPTALLTAISGNFTSSTTVSGTATLKSQPGFDLCCTQTPAFSASNGGGGTALTAGASADVSSGDAPLTVGFTGSANGGTAPYTYSWNFGDCTATSSTQNPSHVYAAGNWYAVLTVTDSASATDDAVVPVTAVPVGITVTPATGLVTPEAGGTATFSVVLHSAPDNDVTIQLGTSDATEGRISSDGFTQQSTLTLTFTPANWNTPKVVTVHGQNDAVDDGNIAYTITTAASVSADSSYNGIDPLDVSATNNDDDVAGVTVNPTAASVAESGTTDDFTVVLNTEPAADVVIDVASTATDEVTVSPAQLTFTNGDWSTPKSVTVTGVDDALIDGDQQTTVTVTVNAAATLDNNYDAIDPADVTVTTIDDETLSIISTNPIANDEAAPPTTNVQATATSNVSAATVTQTTFRVQGEQTGRVAGAYSATGSTFQLNPTNDFKPGELIRVTATSGIQTPTAIAMTPRVWQFTAATSTSTGALMKTSVFQAGVSANVSLGDLDGDGDLDAIFANTAGTTEEVWKGDGAGTFTFFATFGTGDTYDVALGDLDGDGDLDAFAGNRLSDDTIWLNSGTGTFTLHDSVSSEWTVDVTLGDLDRDGDLDAVLANNGGAATVWLNDGTGDFSAHLTTPAFGSGNQNAVALGDIDGDGDLDAVIAEQNSPEQVWLNNGAGAFTAHSTPLFGGVDSNSWDVALGDLDGDGDLDAVVANALTQPEPVWLNDGSGVFVAHGSFGGGDSRAIALGDLDGDGDLDAMVANLGGDDTVWLNDGTAAFAAHPAVASLAGNNTWGIGLGDLDNDGDLDALMTSAEGGENEIVWLNERIIVAPTAGLTTTEGGGTSSFTVVLGRASASDVTIHLATSDASEGRISSDATTQQDSLDVTFTSANWSTPRTITVHGQGDAVDDGDIAYAVVIDAATSSDLFYSSVNPRDVAATNVDDDTAGVNVSTAALTLTESTQATFTVALTSEPAGDVVIDVSSSDTGEATVSPTQLTFTMSNWATPRTVTVSGVSDGAIDGDQNSTIGLTMNAGATADSQYDAIDPADVTATIEDVQTFSILSTTPAANASSAARNTNVSATASDTINASTVTQSTFRVHGDMTGRIAGAYSSAGASFQLDPATNLKPGETIQVTATSGIQNGNGAGLDRRVWQFTAAAATATSVMSQHPGSPQFGGGWSFGGAIGDLDGDGDLDAVIANPSVENETVWLNDGTGTYTAQPATPSFEAGGATAVALGDIDGDGDLDAVFSVNGTNATFVNGGSGNMTAHPVTPTFGSGTGFDVGLADLDGDGDLDAAIGNESGQSLTIWSNDGAGNFTPHPTTPSLGAGLVDEVALGDLDGDGDVDLVAVSYFHQETVWLNDGAGNLSAHPVTPSFDGGAAKDIALGDVNGDGDLDAVIANWGGVEVVYSNNGSGSLTASSTFGATDTRAISLGDLDGDGDLDAIAADNENNSVWRNDGNGTFSAHPLTPTFGFGPVSAELGDLDGDGDLDAFVVSPNAEQIWINRNFAGVTRSKSSVTVAESGTTDTFTVVLNSAPVGNVVIDISSSDTGEATVSPAQLTFTTSDWASPQMVTVTGVNDALNDGDQASTIILTMNTAQTNDVLYDAVDPADVSVTTTDDDISAPSFLTATASGTTEVALTWGLVAGATAYEVYRTTSIAIAYSLVTSVPTTSFNDTGRAENTTYLYKVRAMNGETSSPDSAIDAATTTLFTDPTLTSSTAVKAVHLTQLRTAVSAMRAAANLDAATFTDPTVTTAMPIRRLHVVELRSALDEARSAIGLGALTYTDSTITSGTTGVRAAHVNELRGGTQ